MNDIHRTIAAAVDDEDLLLTAAIGMMDSGENGLYFLNAEGELYGGMSGQCSGKKVSYEREKDTESAAGLSRRGI